MSCNSSSNIRGNSTILNPSGSYARTTLNLLSAGVVGDSGYTMDTNIFAGAVIRYAPLEKTYFNSQANSGISAEVVGVVESQNDNNDYIVVTRGLISYPTGATLNYIADPLRAGSTDGGSGGNDIWFLSAATAGEIQNLAPDESTNVVKPIMQMVATTDNIYNFQVLNYIGYSVGGDVEAEAQTAFPIGATVLIPEDAGIPSGWLEADKQQTELDTTKYADYYSYAGTKYGFVEKVFLNSSLNVNSSSLNKSANTKISGKVTNSGRITNVNTVDNSIEVTKSNGDSIFDTTKSLFINNKSYTIDSTSINKIRTPKITSNNSFSTFVDGTKDNSIKYKVILKIRQLSAVSIPSSIIAKELHAKTLLGCSGAGGEFTDISYEISQIKARLDTLENKVIGIS